MLWKGGVISDDKVESRCWTRLMSRSAVRNGCSPSGLQVEGSAWSTLFSIPSSLDSRVGKGRTVSRTI